MQSLMVFTLLVLGLSESIETGSLAVVCEVHTSFSDFILEFWKPVAQLAVCDVLISMCALV